MIRIIYKWQVPANRMAAFAASWAVVTNQIKDSIPGAQGSVMLTNYANPNEVLTIARWGGLVEWRRFLTGEGPTMMHQMHELGAQVSIEVFEEVDDYTS